MQTSVISFHDRAQAALDDPTLKIAIDRTTGNAEKKRAVAVAAFPQFEATRDLGKRIKMLEKQMLEHARNLEFEKAARVRDQLSLLREGTEEELSAEDAAIEASNALHGTAETSQEPARQSLIVVVGG